MYISIMEGNYCLLLQSTISTACSAENHRRALNPNGMELALLTKGVTLNGVKQQNKPKV